MKSRSSFAGIPRPHKANAELAALTENIEVLTGQRGKGANRALLHSDLVNFDELKRKALIDNVASSNNGGLPIDSRGVGRPHVPVNLTGTGGFTFMALHWDKPTYKGHAYAEIFRADTDSFASAIRIATEVTDTYSDAVDLDVEYYYWVRFVNVADVKGPTQGMVGVYVKTQQSAEQILEGIGGQIEKSHLSNFLVSEIESSSPLEAIEQVDKLALSLMQEALNNDLSYNFSRDNHAKVTKTQKELTNKQVSLAHTQTVLNASLDNVGSTLESNYLTIAQTNSAISQSRTTLKAIIESPEGNSVGATLQTLRQTVATNNNSVLALWGVKSNVNGLQSSVGFINDGTDPIFAIKGAKFAVITDQDPNNVTPIFSVSNGKTVMAKALIDDAHIRSLVTDDLLANRLLIGSKLTTPSINYNPVNGQRSNNFSMSPNGVMHAKSAVLQSVTIKDLNGNVVMSSSGAISANRVSGLGSLARKNSITLASVTDSGRFAGLNKILSNNVTTYIASGAIGSAQINQAYINSLFGRNATFSGTVYARNIEGDVTDAMVKNTRNIDGRIRNSRWQRIVSFNVSAMPFSRYFILASNVTLKAWDDDDSDFELARFSARLMKGRGVVASTDSRNVDSVFFVSPLANTLAANESATYHLEVSQSNGTLNLDSPSAPALAQVFKRGSTLS